MGKTKVMHAQETIHVEKPLEEDTEEVQKLLTERCEACGAGFTTVHGLNVRHGQRQQCDLYRRMDKTEYEVEQVLLYSSQRPS